MSNPVAAAPLLGHDGATPRAAIRAALDLMVEPNAVVELRVPHSRRGTLSGYFDDVDALVNIAADLSGRVEGVYVTLNPVDRALLARAVNRVSEYAKHTTADNNIVRRRWMLVDFDPVRPSGISSTDEEHQRGLARAREARDWLREQGWNGLVFADSGNGAHLLARVDLPNDAPSLALVKKCLTALALRFSDNTVIVDEATANAARLVKCYGTVAAKGDATQERPHRMARILEVDEERR